MKPGSKGASHSRDYSPLNELLACLNKVIDFFFPAKYQNNAKVWFLGVLYRKHSRKAC